MSRMYKFTPENVCSTGIEFDIIEGNVQNLILRRGCVGNLQGIAKLIEGMDANEAIQRLKGIKCRNNTSCPDQIAIALEKALSPAHVTL